MGTITVEIPSRMEEQLCLYCEDKGVSVEDFVFNLIADKLYTDLHGDLNEKITIPKKDTKPKKETSKKKQTETVTETPVKTMGEENKETVEKQEVPSESVLQAEAPTVTETPTRRKRTIQSR